MENIKLRQLAIEFFENHLNPTEDDLYNFLVENAWKIYSNYQAQSFENTVRFELEEQGFDVNKIPEKTIELMAFNLEEMVFDEDCFRDTINNLFYFYREDLEEYKLEEDDDELV